MLQGGARYFNVHAHLLLWNKAEIDPADGAKNAAGFFFVHMDRLAGSPAAHGSSFNAGQW